ncbi:MAG: hypothetical protein R2761_22600 [Acidimicrobiales bacterium]
MQIETSLLVVGTGPGALLVGKLASGRGLGSVIAGHRITGGDEPVPLSDAAVAVLTPHGVFDVLRPYLASHHPVAIEPAAFEEVLKHHCVADMNTTVYDGLELVEAELTEGGGVRGVLTDGRSRWPVTADAYVDAATLPTELSAAVTAAAEVANAIVDRVVAARR